MARSGKSRNDKGKSKNWFNIFGDQWSNKTTSYKRKNYIEQVANDRGKLIDYVTFISSQRLRVTSQLFILNSIFISVICSYEITQTDWFQHLVITMV